MENNMGIAELKAEMKQVKETVKELQENTKQLKVAIASDFERMNAKFNQIINALKTLQLQVEPAANRELSCTIVFGAEPAGAGALLLADDGSQYYGFWQGFGHQTKEGAQYRALILGMRQAFMKGFKHVTVKGDSEFVVNQFGEPWQTNDTHLRSLCLEAMKLRNSFDSFSIQHIPRGQNKAARYYASRALNFQDGEYDEERIT